MRPVWTAIPQKCTHKHTHTHTHTHTKQKVKVQDKLAQSVFSCKQISCSSWLWNHDWGRFIVICRFGAAMC